jgi:predicted nucleic acid-binding protein
VAHKESLKKDRHCEIHSRYECLHSDSKGDVAANRSQNPERRLALIREFLGSFSSVPLDDQIAKKCGEIRAADRYDIQCTS